MIKKIIFIIFLIIFLFNFYTCELLKPSKFGSIKGTVFHINTDVPISGVVVKCDDISTTTSSDGKYVLEDVEIGSKTLKANKSDYEDYKQTIKIKENETLTLDIELTTSILGTNISGIITDIDFNLPVVNAKVTIAGQDDYTDATGHYQLTNIPQGTREIYVIRVS
ncbi:MAG: carboxypeptidase regulatory-like domain-containing protein [Candidatus Marinimicrobia bacterium]|nr:carboxypeptidase regulatory-like domain-containing protein [Candidatus Neomarinimicrobiota bacterium]